MAQLLSGSASECVRRPALVCLATPGRQWTTSRHTHRSASRRVRTHVSTYLCCWTRLGHWEPRQGKPGVRTQRLAHTGKDGLGSFAGEADDEQAPGGTDVEQAPGETDVEQAWASMGSMQHCWWLGSVDAVRPPWQYCERFGAPCPSSSCGWPISQVDGAAFGGRAFSASTAQAPASQAHRISDFAAALDLG